MLLRPQGFHVFCDPRNLIHVFAPGTQVKKHVRSKLFRWALKITGYRYVICHIDGPKNVWADMISRWAGPPAAEPLSVCVERFGLGRSSHKTPRPQTATGPILRPLDDDGLIWPSLAEIAAIQAIKQTPVDGKMDEHGVYRVNNRI